MELNDIRNRNFLYEGQVLALAKAARAAPRSKRKFRWKSSRPRRLPEPAADRRAAAAAPSAKPRRSVRRWSGTQAADEPPGRLLGRHRRQGDRAGGRNSRSLRRMARRARERPAPPEQDVVCDAGRCRPQGETVVREGHARPVRTRRRNITASCRKLLHAVPHQGHDHARRTAGESIWVIAQQRYNIPIWLLRQYNPDLDLGDIRPGTKLVIPLVEPPRPRPRTALHEARLVALAVLVVQRLRTAQLYDGPRRT